MPEKLSVLLAGPGHELVFYQMQPAFVADTRLMVAGQATTWDTLQNSLNTLKPEVLVVHASIASGADPLLKLLATLPDAGGNCNASAPTASNLISGMRAWGSSLHALPTFPVTYGTAETPFSFADLGDTEFNNLTLYCRAIQSFIGGGYGICNTCRTGALGASQK